MDVEHVTLSSIVRLIQLFMKPEGKKKENVSTYSILNKLHKVITKKKTTEINVLTDCVLLC